jgi:hypothetical protein
VFVMAFAALQRCANSTYQIFCFSYGVSLRTPTVPRTDV